MARCGRKLLLAAATLLLGAVSSAAAEDAQVDTHHQGYLPASAYLLEAAAGRQGSRYRHHCRREL